MDMPQLKPSQIQEISALVANYIRAQRENFLGRAGNLPAALRLSLTPFFRAYFGVCERPRVVALDLHLVVRPAVTFSDAVFADRGGENTGFVHEVAMIQVPRAQEVQERKRLEPGIVVFTGVTLRL
jgi:hypothetical protein